MTLSSDLEQGIQPVNHSLWRSEGRGENWHRPSGEVKPPKWRRLG